MLGIRLSVTLKRMTRDTVGLARPMAISEEHRSTFAALHRQWRRLQLSENYFYKLDEKNYKKKSQNLHRDL